MPGRAPAPASSSSSLDLFAPQEVSRAAAQTPCPGRESTPAQRPPADRWTCPSPARRPLAPAQVTPIASSGDLLDLSAPSAVVRPRPAGPPPRPARRWTCPARAPAPARPHCSIARIIHVARSGCRAVGAAATAAGRPGSSTSLDLGCGAGRPIRGTGLSVAPRHWTCRRRAARPSAPAAGPRSSGPPAPAATGTSSRWREPRTTPRVSTILTPQSPTVTLTRVQSGVGTLTFEAVAAPGVGDLRLGCAYQLASGRSSTVQHQAGRRFAPPGETRRPLLLAARQQFERLEFDLRQVTDLERLCGVCLLRRRQRAAVGRHAGRHHLRR